MTSLMRVDLHTRKVCFNLAASHCCDDPLTESDRFEVAILSEGRLEDTGVSYPIFEVNSEAYMCIVLDDAMKNLIPGRYLFQVIFDGCVVVDSIRFLWGGKPVITDVTCESDPNSTEDGCFGDFETDITTSQKLPDACPDEADDLLPDDCDSPCYPIADYVRVPLRKN